MQFCKSINKSTNNVVMALLFVYNYCTKKREKKKSSKTNIRKKSNFLNNFKSLWAEISDQVHPSHFFFFKKSEDVDF